MGTDGRVMRGLSRVLRNLDSLSSRAGFAIAVAVAVVVFAIVGVAAGMPQTWQTGFATVASAITLVMVFSIQHAQRREQVVTQLKLDELLKSHPQADDLVVKAEESPDDELHDIRERQLEDHDAVRGGQRGDGAR